LGYGGARWTYGFLVFLLEHSGLAWRPGSLDDMATAAPAKTGTVIEIPKKGKADWDSILKSAANDGKPVVVDFSATWCGPCRLMSPYFDEQSKVFTDVVFVKVDVDDNEEVAAEAGISAMPTFQVYKDGQKAEELVGASKEKLLQLIERFSNIKSNK